MLGSWLQAESSVPERLLRRGQEGNPPLDAESIEKNERRAEKFLRLVDITIEENSSGDSSGHSSPEPSG